jgi:hypothetical protein
MLGARVRALALAYRLIRGHERAALKRLEIRLNAALRKRSSVMRTDYLPRAFPEFREWANNFIFVISANKTAWELPETGVKALQDEYAAYCTVDDSASGPDATKSWRIRRKEANKAFIKNIRRFVNKFMNNNDKIGPAERAEAGLNPHTGGGGGHNPKPTTMVEAKVDSSIIRRITIRFKDAVSTSRAKPKGVHGAEIRWAILDHFPLSVNELIHSEFDTSSPYTLIFDDTDRGKTLYFCLRWENTVNEKGPWSEIYSAIIP